MGKRKLHEKTHFTCDWTGIPMQASNCYYPVINKESKKVSKRGSYCNWEAVLAHVHYMYADQKEIEREEFHSVLDHVLEITGPIDTDKINERLHYTYMEHFTIDDKIQYWQSHYDVPPMWSARDFQEKACGTIEEALAVKVKPSGDVFEVIMDPHDGKFEFETYLTRPFMLQGPLHRPMQFELHKKGKIPRDRELVVHYWPHKNGESFNQIASTMFKVQIYGDALITMRTKEASFLPRERYVSISKQTYEEIFQPKKRKREDAPPEPLSTEIFKDLKSKMQSELNEFEQHASASSELPGQTAKVAGMPPATGKELMEAARLMEQQVTPPAPTLRREVSVMGG